MNTSSPVVQLGAVSSMSGPHSILEVGEKNENKVATKENDVQKTTQKKAADASIESNHLQESDLVTSSNQPQSAQSIDFVPEDCEDEDNTFVADSITVNKKPPPLEV